MIASSGSAAASAATTGALRADARSCRARAERACVQGAARARRHRPPRVLRRSSPGPAPGRAEARGRRGRHRPGSRPRAAPRPRSPSARLATARGARERHRSLATADQADQLLDLGVAAEQGRFERREVRVGRRLGRSERLAQEVQESLGRRRQGHAAGADDRDRARQPPARYVEDRQPPGLKLRIEREPADCGDSGACGCRTARRWSSRCAARPPSSRSSTPAA
jgi:hypothetical protein